MIITFKRNEEGIKQLAIFLAELIRQNIGFQINNAELFVDVILTGGF